jgi:hypothetical protein
MDSKGEDLFQRLNVTGQEHIIEAFQEVELSHPVFQQVVNAIKTNCKVYSFFFRSSSTWIFNHH